MSASDSDPSTLTKEEIDSDSNIEEVFVGFECLDEKWHEVEDKKNETKDTNVDVIEEKNEYMNIEFLSFWDIHNVEENNEDEIEENIIDNFTNKICCQKKCVLHWDKQEILQFRSDCRSLDYFENGKNLLDTVLLGIIRSMCKSKKIIKHARKSVEKERKRLKLLFMFQGIEICESFFLFVHAIKIKRFRRLLKHYKNKGLQINLHGNTKKLDNTISLEHHKFVVKFIEKYAEENALCMLGNNYTMKVLPSDVTKIKIYRLYQNACKKQNIPHVGKSTFHSLWSQFSPDVVVQKPQPSLKSENIVSISNVVSIPEIGSKQETIKEEPKRKKKTIKKLKLKEDESTV